MSMNLEALQAKTVVLFGKPRALDEAEFKQLLQTAHISLSAQWDGNVAAVIEGRLVNPVEQDELDRLYAEHGVIPVDINTFEHALCSQIEPDRILMSLKLTRDRERLRAFLQNPHISDAFFLRLLGLYDWRNEGFFDNDENRDVTAALISRFYEHIERNHNVQYSALGLMHLIGQHRTPELIRTLGNLPPLRRAVTDGDRQLRAILDALARHPAADETTLKHFVRQGDNALRTLVAARPGLTAVLQKELFALHQPNINAALAANPDLDTALADLLFDNPALAAVGFAHIILDESRFEQGLTGRAASLAANPTLTPAMQLRLLNLHNRSVLIALAANPNLQCADTLMQSGEPAILAALAANPALPPRQLEALAETGHCDAALAGNPSTPPHRLEAFYAGGDADVLAALAANPATPIAVLQQLQLDTRFERAVRSNDAFGAFIKRENIGWL